ncbi:hypothetical protein Y1Q_0007071 [Alligator mississippiensis]|uniref:Uncharacterized protein n=1 Tax=Alligator mississippiensis TaxID=8496 RepID=A0A151N5I9_ALLMI|nr:hypothetical protein Y1Q_0007071 [Alligator mississippiensis]
MAYLLSELVKESIYKLSILRVRPPPPSTLAFILVKLLVLKSYNMQTDPMLLLMSVEQLQSSIQNNLFVGAGNQQGYLVIHAQCTVWLVAEAQRRV